ncbi:DUF1493 family protein [Herbaspirillum frisingense]|uniref:DUF1493 family protein n=1 Tax=Herbaspirillum frisingense TaxID=92645 RepID=UPI0016025625|nr:DUF1493 family protein [Herbaspirillum frisingense]
MTSPKKPVTRDTQLNHDLDVTGDDAADFIRHFLDEFSIDHGEYSFDRSWSRKDSIR